MDTNQMDVAAFFDCAFNNIPLPPSKFPCLEKHPLALEGRRILFPFLGELGLEVRGFLGQIEPWLRSGWIIPARRPGLYPKFSSFDDPVFFERIEEIKKEYGLFEMVGRLATFNKLSISLAWGQLDQDFQFNISSKIEDNLIPALSAQRDLHVAFLDRYGNDQLVPTKWHTQLSSQLHSDDNIYMSARHATIPSYLPDLFVNPPFDFYPHIGIQLRNVPLNPSRNSDPIRMGQMATLASQMLNLPVLVYGRPTDFPLPGFTRTIDYLPAGTPQLSAELVFLKSCKLMISPGSGWADLMGWLRVPTLTENLVFQYGLESLRPFRPKILVADENTGIAEAITTLCNCDEDATILPDPEWGDNKQSDFLRPDGKECTEFRKNYRGQGG